MKNIIAASDGCGPAFILGEIGDKKVEAGCGETQAAEELAQARFAGGRAYGAAHLHQRMNDEGGGGAPLPFLSTHPSGPERIKTLTELADRLSEN